ncbi:AAA family ATPase [Rhizobacter sp. Root1221]|uniref:AAA family ATPase n=1 Tax=Rhizobacter sp. Root1221 TaxID=1736433 RepID=UPI0006FB12FF|nr:AAA family ATPase [Rhizobacter sp. Root1221]KQV99667.1 hypothetical protein ASC87_02925 [Rhizobacter sp. Root1221]
MASLKRFRLGLVVGKFAPLHLGHLALIDHAAAQCDRLLLLSYSNPEFPGLGPERRRRWLAAVCPGHEALVLDGADAPPNSADDRTHQRHLASLLMHLQRRPDAMFASEPYVGPCAAVLSAALGHPVAPVLFDPARALVPVSATAIRARPASMLDWLPAAVRADLVPRVALLGGESTGKTTLAAALAHHWGTVWVAEYGRERWEVQGGELTEPDLLAIAIEQGRREDMAARTAAPVLVCDTSPLTTFGYAHWMHGRADPALADLADRPYTLNVLCGDDIAFHQDGSRLDAAFRTRQQAWYREQLAARGMPWIEVRGPLAARVRATVAAMPFTA